MKASKIVLPEDNQPIQDLLFGGVEMPDDLQEMPMVSKREQDLHKILAMVPDDENLGLDFEFRPNLAPSIVGVSYKKHIVSLPWKNHYADLLLDAYFKRGVKYIGHSVVGAEKAVLEKVVGKELPIEMFHDSLIVHFLANSVLTKAPGKQEDADDSGSLGFMNLQCAISLVADTPVYKICRGLDCSGPCPKCRVYDYNGIDTWAGQEVYYRNWKKLRERGASFNFYRELVELENLCHKMQKRGIRVNLDYVKELEKNFDERKLELFPSTTERKVTTWKWFNPRSTEQALEWYAQRSIQLEATDKISIKKALERQAAKFGYKLSDLDTAENLPEELDVLYRHHEYKRAGRGFDAWFAPKYITKHDKENFLHPRWNSTGASTGRWSSSSCNMTNVPARGFGELIRKAIIPRSDDIDIAKSDYSQGELRMCLYLSGVDPSVAGKDAFTFLVEKGNGQFEKVAEDMNIAGFDARDVTKSVSHACLTGDHEVLTPTGWIRIESWRGEEIAEWDKDEIITFRKPLHFHKYDDADTLNIKGTAIDQVVTPNHNMPLLSTGNSSGKKYRIWKDDIAKNIKNWKSKRIPLSGRAETEEIYSDLEIRQAIAIQADGSKAGKNSWRFHVKKERKRVRLEELFGKPMTKTPYGTYKLCTIFNSPLLSENKQLTWEFLKLSVRQKRLCIEECFLWDGYKGKTHQVYRNSDLHSVTVLQTIAHLCGMEGLIREAPKGGYPGSSKLVYKLRINNQNYAWIGSLSVTTCLEKSVVYCFTTESGYFLVRRNKTISVTGNSNYLEGFITLSGFDLMKPSTKNSINAGALYVYHPKYNPEVSVPWEFRGRVVAFTGANLAERLFKGKTYELRKKALAIQEMYFKQFPMLRAWHRKILAEVEDRGYFRSATGRIIDLYGSPEDDAKITAAGHGQGCFSDHVYGIVLRMYRERGDIPLLVVHDEVDIEVPRSWGNKQVMEYMAIMGEETSRLPGFRCVASVSRGQHWGPRWRKNKDGTKTELCPHGLDSIGTIGTKS